MTFEEYIKQHDISPKSIEKFGLKPVGSELVIPVCDENEKVLYNKYRNLNLDKDPGGNKFRFDTGAKTTLFNIKALKNDKNYVCLCEGEMDAVRLDQEDIFAVSGTTGASTFKDEWVSEFKSKSVFICYDNDNAGRENSSKVAQKLSDAGIKSKVVELPEGIKDICEFFAKGHTKEEFMDLCKKARNLEVVTASKMNILGFEIDITDPLRFTVEKDGLTYKLASIEDYRADFAVYFDKKLCNRELVLLTSSKTRSAFIKNCRYLGDEQKAKLKDHLIDIVDVLDQLQEKFTKKEETKPELTEKEKAEAIIEVLESPVLLYELLKVIRKTGVTGEEENALAHYLTFTSRVLEDPLSIVVKGESSAGKSYVLLSVMKLIPTDAYVDITDATPQSFYYAPKDHFAHKIIVIFERHGQEKADYSIRSFQSERKLKIQVTVKDPDTGQFTAKELTVDGPVGFITTTTDANIHSENETRNLSLYPDESKEQTEKIFEVINSKYKNASKLSPEELKKWQNVQKVIKPYKVLIPFVDKLGEVFPKEPTRVRRDYDKLLALISVIALIHQEQRQKSKVGNSEYLIATLSDFYIAKVLFEGIFQKTIFEIPPKSQLLIASAKTITKDDLEATVTIRELADHLGWDYDTAQKWFSPAFKKGFFKVIEQHKGSKAAIYRPSSKELSDKKILPEIEELYEVNPGWLGDATVYDPLTGEILKFQEIEVTTDVPMQKEMDYINKPETVTDS